VDPNTQNQRAGLGACTGDSGSPVFVNVEGALAVMGLVSWSTGPKNSDGCGGLTGVTPLTRYRGWVVDQAKRMGSPVEP
jgi:secreted trypsin-like serine protease